MERGKGWSLFPLFFKRQHWSDWLLQEMKVNEFSGGVRFSNPGQALIELTAT